MCVYVWVESALYCPRGRCNAARVIPEFVLNFTTCNVLRLVYIIYGSGESDDFV